MKARGSLLILLAAWLLAACNDDEPPPQPGSFDRPTRVAFACFNLRDTENPTVESLSACDYPGGVPVTTEHVLHALVIQSSRGEVGAVDLVNRRTLDSRRDIPGYTFLPVGELPAAIVVPKTAPHAEFTYVANAGSRDITVLHTRAFRTLAAKESPTVQTLALPGGNLDSPVDMVLSPDEDALFVALPQTGRVLRVPIQRCDRAQPEPADAGEPPPCVEGWLDENGITELPLNESVAKAAMSATPDIPQETYLKLCDYSQPVSNASLPVPALPGDAATTPPQPSGFAVDDFCQTGETCKRRLLISDRALPLIHVVDIEALAAADAAAIIQPPILTGVPTSAVAVTPRVPVDLSLTPAETQYVYAIDATDGSVLVTQNGRVLEAGDGMARRDRVALGDGVTMPVAISLGIMTPAFDVHGPVDQYAVRPNGSALPKLTAGNFCVDEGHTQRSNARLRGVFLAVGTTDGRVRVIDIHDMDLAECRSCDKYMPDCRCGDSDSNVCNECAQTWDPYPVIRHRARIASNADPQKAAPPLQPQAAPAFRTPNGTTLVRDTGSTSDPEVKGLDCVSCAEDQSAAFPVNGSTSDTTSGGVGSDGTEPGASSEGCEAGSARVCALNDPWTQVDDWFATYRGAIPGTRGGDTTLTETGDRGELQTQPRFCGLGVLGSDALGDGDGDQLVILNALPSDAAIKAAEPRKSSPKSFEADALAACKALVKARDDANAPEPIAFQILEAYDDRLVVSSSLTKQPETRTARFDNDIQLVRKCFGGNALSYEVRAGRGYVVSGLNVTGFAHRVRAEEGSGRCAEDASLPATRTSRAFEGTPFNNGRVAFQIRTGGAPKVDTLLGLGLAPTTAKAATTASLSLNQQVVAAIPVDVRWSNEDDTLYVVDIASRGLIPLSVDPYPVSVSRSYQ